MHHKESIFRSLVLLSHIFFYFQTKALKTVVQMQIKSVWNGIDIPPPHTQKNVAYFLNGHFKDFVQFQLTF
jgi:hypothetical protein